MNKNLKLHCVVIYKHDNHIRYNFTFDGHNDEVFSVSEYLNYAYYECDMTKRELKTFHNGERYVAYEPTGQKSEVVQSYINELYNQALHPSYDEIFFYEEDKRIAKSELIKWHKKINSFK